ncbi:MAG: sigma-70 family RNA polymerase sigma factor [Actinobacteria bacterium]|nr:sigma-70 family RNA polymerase sigma factor [Actinomycetota bacterium]
MPDDVTAGDAELVDAARSGDQAAFAAIYDRYADRLHDFCHSVLRDRHDAADAMQDTFVLAAQRLGQLRDPSKLRPWLFAIARHEALRRAKARGRATPTEDAGVDVAAATASPEDVVSRRDAGAIVWDAAAGLSDRDRVLLDLHLRQGLDGQELADAIGTTASQAYVLMSRLRDQVERALGALLVARLGREDCEQLQAVLSDWDGTFSPVWRKRVARHVDGCQVCSEKRKTLLSPLSLLAAAPLVPAPMVLRDQTLDRVRTISNVRPAGAWRHPSARGGFPPPMIVNRRRRPLLAAAAAALFLIPAVIVAEPRGRGGGEPEVASARRDVTTTTAAPTTSTAPTTTTTDAPVAPVAPPPDTTGPLLSAVQGDDCYSTFSGSNPISATATDPSSVASVTLTASGPNMTSPGSQAMSPSGGNSYTASISWNGLGTISWTVTAADSVGNTSSSSGSFIVQTTSC